MDGDKDRLDDIERRLTAIEAVLHGAPDPHEGDANYPRPPPPPPGLLAQVKRIRGFLSLDGSRFESGHIRDVIDDDVRGRIDRERERDHEVKFRRSLRGRAASWLFEVSRRLERPFYDGRRYPRMHPSQANEDNDLYTGVFEGGF